MMTLIQAQQRMIDRVTTCHAVHALRVLRAAARELYRWAAARGFDAQAIVNDARDMVRLELLCD